MPDPLSREDVTQIDLVGFETEPPDFDDETDQLEPIDNPFGATVLPMRPE